MSYKDLAGSYMNVFEDMGGMSFDPAPGFNLDYTTKPPLGGDSTLPSSPEGPKAGMLTIGGMQFDPSKLSEDTRLALAMHRYENDPDRLTQMFREIDRIQTGQAEKMMKFGIQANLIGSLLKDVPKAITNATRPFPGYYDRLTEMGRAPFTAAQAMPLGGAAVGAVGSGRSGYFRNV